MPRLATGNVYERRGKWFARLTIAPQKRQSFMLAKCGTKEDAEARQMLLAEMATKLSLDFAPILIDAQHDFPADPSHSFVPAHTHSTHRSGA